MRTFLAGLARVVTVIALMVCLVAGGYLAVALPDLPTQMLSQTFSPSDSSPFTKDELVRAAVAGKRYTFNDHDKQALYNEVAAMNERAAADGDTQAVADSGFPDVTAMEQSFANADERYVLTPDAISHLDDCWPVAVGGYIAFFAALVIAVIGLVWCGRRGGRRTVGAVLLASGIVVLALFAALGIWAAIDFNGLFAAFHSLFFTAGTWTFSWDSLLITMYPLEFWVGMGAIWLVVTVLFSVTCIVIGALLRRHRRALSGHSNAKAA